MNHHFETSQRLQKFLIDIIKSALSSPMTNLVKINTNLDCNVPEKDIHKIAGPFIDEWTYEIFNLLQVKKVAVLKTFTYHLN